jgi:hypothetical protein
MAPGGEAAESERTMRDEPEQRWPQGGYPGRRQPPNQPQPFGRDPSSYEPTRPYPGGGEYGGQGQGQGSYGGYGGQGPGGYGGYDDPTYPSQQQPGQYVPPPTPNRVPRWPDPNQPPAQQPPQRPAYSPHPPAGYGYGEPMGQRAYAPPAVERRPPAPARHAERHPAGHALPHLPIAHVFLIAGLAAMFFAVGQQWGVDAQGNAIFVSSFTSPSVQHITGVDTGIAASKLAYGIVIAAAALSLAMILFNIVVTAINKVIGVVGLGGCATLLFFPVLWGAGTLLFVVLLGAAGFAGLGFLSGLPAVQAHGLSTISMAHYSLGWYLWVGGATAVFIGMLGQLVLRRR